MCYFRQIPETKAYLFLNGLQKPFSEMRFTHDLRQYDNKIIECSYHNGQWHFHRHRTDKSFPNAKGISNFRNFFSIFIISFFSFLETAFGKFLHSFELLFLY